MTLVLEGRAVHATKMAYRVFRKRLEDTKKKEEEVGAPQEGTIEMIATVDDILEQMKPQLMLFDPPPEAIHHDGQLDLTGKGQPQPGEVVDGAPKPAVEEPPKEDAPAKEQPNGGAGGGEPPGFEKPKPWSPEEDEKQRKKDEGEGTE